MSTNETGGNRHSPTIRSTPVLPPSNAELLLDAVLSDPNAQQQESSSSSPQQDLLSSSSSSNSTTERPTSPVRHPLRSTLTRSTSMRSRPSHQTSRWQIIAEPNEPSGADRPQTTDEKDHDNSILITSDEMIVPDQSAGNHSSSGKDISSPEKQGLTGSSSPGPSKSKTRKTKVKKKTTFLGVNKKIWISIFVVAVVAFAVIGVISHSFAPTVSIKGSPLVYWAIFVEVVLVSAVVAWFISRGLIALCESTLFLQQNVYYFVNALQRPVAALLWLVIVYATMVPIFRLPNDPATQSALGEVRLTMRIAIYICLMFCMKAGLIKFAAARLNRKVFFDGIKSSVFNERILETLVTGSPNRSSMMLGSHSSRDLSKDTEIKTLVKRGPVSGFKTWMDNVRKWHHLSPDMTGVKSDVKAVDAEDYVDDIFSNLDGEGKGYLVRSDFELFLKPKYVQRAWKLFNGPEDPSAVLYRDEAVNAVINILKERRALFTRLQDNEDIGLILNEVVSYLFWTFVLLFILYMYGVDIQVILVSTGTITLGLSFIFGITIRSMFESIILIFFVRPYDIGDKIMLDSKDTLIVDRVGLIFTQFKSPDGKAVYIPNSKITASKIENFNRSEEVSVSIDLKVDFDTPNEKIAQLEAKIKEYLRARPEHWKPDFSITPVEFESIEGVTLRCGASILSSWQNSKSWRPLKSDFLFKMRDWVIELGFKPPHPVGSAAQKKD